MASRTNRVLTDHDEIRRWAEERNANPACVRGTGGKEDIGMLRLDFPGYSGANSLEAIGWGDWFDKFDERGLALLVQDQTARGERSNFNKIVSRETARAARGGARRKSARGTRATARKRTATKRTAAKSRSRATAKKTAARKRTAAKSTRTTAARKTRSRSTAAKRTSTRRKSSATKARKTSPRRSARTAASTRSRSASQAKVQPIRSGRGKASHVLTDHDEIRRWAEERNASPACVRGTGGGKDPGMIRLDFPGFSGARSLEHIDWDEWFRAFDDNNLALVVQDTRARGGRSNFNKLTGRETAAHRAQGERKWSRRHPQRSATSRTRASAKNTGTKKAERGSTRARRTESARGRTTSQRRAA